MIELIFATNNLNKVIEIQAAIGNDLHIITLAEAGILIEIPEPYDTLEANASEKSRTIFELTGKSCFSEDTGLEVACLNGEPGVRSARYAGEDSHSSDNIKKLLGKMENATNRSARFRTVVSLRAFGEEFLFEGICEGKINYHPVGTNGFGYDAIFEPLGTYKTFAEMTLSEKSMYSHRKRASDKLVVFLQNKVNATSKAHKKRKCEFNKQPKY